MAQGFYELKVAKDGQFMFNLKAANGQVILTSELYKTKASAENGIASVQKNGVDAKNFEYRVAKNDKPYFVLKAAPSKNCANTSGPNARDKTAPPTAEVEEKRPPI